MENPFKKLFKKAPQEQPLKTPDKNVKKESPSAPMESKGPIAVWPEKLEKPIFDLVIDLEDKELVSFLRGKYAECKEIEEKDPGLSYSYKNYDKKRDAGFQMAVIEILLAGGSVDPVALWNKLYNGHAAEEKEFKNAYRTIQAYVIDSVKKESPQAPNKTPEKVEIKRDVKDSLKKKIGEKIDVIDSTIEINEVNKPLLESKLAEYKERLNKPEYKLKEMDTIFKIAVVEELLFTGRVDIKALFKKLREKYEFFNVKAFDKACKVIKDYNDTGGQNVRK